jgi:Spy/CpxP family protein refolding chaperone
MLCSLAVGGVLAAPGVAWPQAATPAVSANPTLAEAVQKVRTELALTDEQAAKVRTLIAERVPRAEAAVEAFGDISLDSILDLLHEARSIKDEFVPELTAVLTPEQKTKLANLPRDSQMWLDVGAAWMTEARVKKLVSRVKLTDAQVPQIRDLYQSQFKDAADSIAALVRGGDAESRKKEILDAVLDLRASIRAGQRKVDRLLTPEQHKALEAYKDESEEASQAKDKGNASGVQ